jgi:hypothetical protein
MRTHARVLLTVAVLLTASSARAGIIGVTGDFLIVPSATASYVADAYNDATPAPIRIWIEQVDIALSAAVTLDTDLANPALRYVIGAPGAGEIAFAPGSGPMLPVGLRVNVYYVYFDPLNDSATGTVTFGEDILGIVAYTEQLPMSDFLRVPGAPYPGVPAFPSRGWEIAESASVNMIGTALDFAASASSPGDQFRIFTVAAVPEPGTLALLTVVAAGLATRRRRR